MKLIKKINHKHRFNNKILNKMKIKMNKNWLRMNRKIYKIHKKMYLKTFRRMLDADC